MQFYVLALFSTAKHYKQHKQTASHPGFFPLALHFQIDFKILLITFKACLGLAPSYLAEMLTPYKPVCSFRSSGGSLRATPNSKLKSKGAHAFTSRSPQLWMTCLRRQDSQNQ